MCLFRLNLSSCKTNSRLVCPSSTEASHGSDAFQSRRSRPYREADNVAFIISPPTLAGSGPDSARLRAVCLRPRAAANSENSGCTGSGYEWGGDRRPPPLILSSDGPFRVKNIQVFRAVSSREAAALICSPARHDRRRTERNCAYANSLDQPLWYKRASFVRINGKDMNGLDWRKAAAPGAMHSMPLKTCSRAWKPSCPAT